MPARDPRRPVGHPIQRAVFRALPSLALAVAGCAHSGAPDGLLPTPDEAATSVRGGWMILESPGPRRTTYMVGEFLAQEGDSLYLLTDSGFRAVSAGTVTRATLWGYDSQIGPLGVWVLAGSLSTLSHGFGLVFSFPVWVIGGSAMVGSQSRLPRLVWPDHQWSELCAYARYPAGLPPGLPRASLRFR